MTGAQLLADAFGRIEGVVHAAADGLSEDQLAARVDGDANSIAWLVWHLTRIQDDHVADVAGVEQRWTADGWYDRFALPFPPETHGYGHTSADVARVDVDGALLRGYFDAVHEVTIGYVGGLVAGDLDRIVDERWDPPVSLGVRLVSVVSVDLQRIPERPRCGGWARSPRGSAGDRDHTEPVGRRRDAQVNSGWPTEERSGSPHGEVAPPRGCVT